MKCHEARRRLDLFMDGELHLCANMEILQHLNLCPACSRIFEGEKELRCLLREQRTPAPAGLRERIQSRVRKPVWPAIAVPAAAVVLAAVLFFLLSSPETQLESIVAAAAREHNAVPAGICVDCSSKEQIRHYFKNHAGYLPCTHDFQEIGYKYEYATANSLVIRGRQVCWMIHHNGATNGTISHVSFPADLIDSWQGGRKVDNAYVFEYRGRTAVLRKCGKMICLFIADDPDATRHLIASVSR